MTLGRTSLEWTISELCALISLQNFYGREIPRLLFSPWKYQKSLKITSYYAATICNAWSKLTCIKTPKMLWTENSMVLTLNMEFILVRQDFKNIFTRASQIHSKLHWISSYWRGKYQSSLKYPVLYPWQFPKVLIPEINPLPLYHMIFNYWCLWTDFGLPSNKQISISA